MDPLSAGVFASIGSAFKFADIAVRIAEVGSENAVFVRTICVVRSDLEEVERLLSLDPVQKKLAATPGKLPWIRNALHNTRYALNEIGKWVERARVEQESTGSIKFDTRVRWVFSDHEKLVNRKTELSTCHQQLSNILGFLVGLEVAPTHRDSQEYGDYTYYDDILARHRRISRPRAPNKDIERKSNTAQQDVLSQPISANLILPSDADDRSLPSVRRSCSNKRDSSLRPLSLKLTLPPPESPPPAYATAVFDDPLTHHARPSCDSPGGHQVAGESAVAGRSTDYKITLESLHGESWADRGSFKGVAIPELAGHTVTPSATNSAGPVNPGITPRHAPNGSRRPHDSISEMLGDLHFPVELPTNDPVPPPGYPQRSRAASDQVVMLRKSLLEMQTRTMSETRPVIQRRPVPTSAFSDSSLTAYELPQSLDSHNAPLNVPHNAPFSITNAVSQTNARSITPEALLGSPHHLESSQRPLSYTAPQSQRRTQAPTPVPSRHYSTPPLIPVNHPSHAAAFSAESTASWGLDTQPKVLKLARAQEPVKATRMQSQKRMMDLLGSIGG